MIRLLVFQHGIILIMTTVPVTVAVAIALLSIRFPLIAYATLPPNPLCELKSCFLI